MEGGKQQPKGHQVPLGGCLHTGQGSPKIRFSFRDKYFKKMKHQGEVQSGKINNTDSYSWSLILQVQIWYSHKACLQKYLKPIKACLVFHIHTCLLVKTRSTYQAPNYICDWYNLITILACSWLGYTLTTPRPRPFSTLSGNKSNPRIDISI